MNIWENKIRDKTQADLQNWWSVTKGSQVEIIRRMREECFQVRAVNTKRFKLKHNQIKIYTNITFPENIWNSINIDTNKTIKHKPC